MNTYNIGIWIFVIVFLALIAWRFSAGCTQITAKSFGGSMTVKLEPEMKLVNCTWKEDHSLWLLTTARVSNEVARTYKFQEKSTMGILQGEVIIQEQ